MTNESENTFTEDTDRNEGEHHPDYSVAGPEAAGHDNVNKSKTNEDKPEFSLAGPAAEGESEEEYDSYDSDEGFGEYGRRPKAEYGVSRPFPKARRGERWRKTLHKRRRKFPYGKRGDRSEREPQMESQTDLTGHDAKHLDEEQVGTEPNFWFGIRRMIREPLAEWLATMVLVLMGISANLQYMTSEGAYGGYSQMAAMWGLAYLMAIHIAGGISGAHCSPVVSINFFVFRGFPGRKTAIYIGAQILGAMCGTLIAFGVYKDAIRNFDPEMTSESGKGFYTMPAEFASTTTAFFTDFTSAAVMSGTVLAMGDSSNSPPATGMHGLIMGLVGTAVTGCLGYNTGPQVNPAKDIASRLVPRIVGYGPLMWQNLWWAEAWAAAIFGGLFGCLIYDLAIYEGPESPINFPKYKVRKATQGNKAKLFKTGLFGAKNRAQARDDLEQGIVGINSRLAGHRLDGHRR